jgi:hypothetical protein
MGRSQGCLHLAIRRVGIEAGDGPMTGCTCRCDRPIASSPDRTMLVGVI